MKDKELKDRGDGVELLWVQITQSLFRGRKYRWGVVFVECHVDPHISKATTVKERVVTSCAESQSTLCEPNRTRFLSVQSVIRAKM
jgi:hypothetical protein